MFLQNNCGKLYINPQGTNLIASGKFNLYPEVSL